MTIKSVIKKEETIEKEISLPYFCKNKDGEYFAIVSENECIWMINKAGYKQTTVCGVWLKETDIGKSEEIKPNEFYNAYQDVHFTMDTYLQVYANTENIEQ